MYEYRLNLESELNQTLIDWANREGCPPRELLLKIVQLVLSAAHKINIEEMAEGYVSMGAINIKLADINIRNGRTDAKAEKSEKGGNILR